MITRPPPAVDDDAGWDLEALKLRLINPRTFKLYIHRDKNGLNGSTGLGTLGFDIDHNLHCGHPLMDACRRIWLEHNHE